MSLKIVRIEAENIRGIANGVLEPHTITVLRGSNGTGKTSWLDAVRIVFDGGYDPLIMRNGEKKARVEMTLSDGTTCTRLLNAEKKTSTLTVKSAEGEVIKAPKAYIDEIADTFAYNPLSLIFADKKERQKVIQGFLNVSVQVQELQAAIGEDWFFEHYDPRKNAFENIDAIYKAGYERRRKVNTQKDEADKTIQTLRRDIPTVSEDAEQFQRRYDEARNALEMARGDKRVAEAELKEQHEASKAEADEWERAEIAKIKAEKQARLAQAEKVRAEMSEEIAQRYNPIIEAAFAEADSASKDLAAYQNAEGLRKHLAEMDARAKELAGASVRYDRALEKLEILRRKKMEDLPIPGAEMRDGDLFIEGVAFDGLNTAEQIKASIQIAASRAKDLPFMLIDGVERLDEENQRELYEVAKASGFQILAAEVVDGMPLTPVEA